MKTIKISKDVEACEICGEMLNNGIVPFSFGAKDEMYNFHITCVERELVKIAKVTQERIKKDE